MPLRYRTQTINPISCIPLKFERGNRVHSPNTRYMYIVLYIDALYIHFGHSQTHPKRDPFVAYSRVKRCSRYCRRVDGSSFHSRYLYIRTGSSDGFFPPTLSPLENSDCDRICDYFETPYCILAPGGRRDGWFFFRQGRPRRHARFLPDSPAAGPEVVCL